MSGSPVASRLRRGLFSEHPWSHPRGSLLGTSRPKQIGHPVDTRPTLLKVLLTERHWQRYETFRTEYERAAAQLAPELRHTAPSRAQYFRWLTGQLKGGTPYPDACRVLEGMFPPWSADDLFGPPLPADGAATDELLASVPQSFPV